MIVLSRTLLVHNEFSHLRDEYVAVFFCKPRNINTSNKCIIFNYVFRNTKAFVGE